MKKIFILICSILILLAFSNVIAADFTIVVSPQKISVNGNQKDFEVYNIDGNNFFKLRDIAYVLNGTLSQFSVDYNESTRFIESTKGKEYTSNGTEMKAGIDNSSLAVKSSQKLYINGEEKELLAYNIAGNNFFKLRDLGTNLDFLVDYNSLTNTVIVESKKENPIANITDISTEQHNGVMCVKITADNPINIYTDFSIYEEDSNRIVIDIPDSSLQLNHSQIEVNSVDLNKIRVGNQGGSLNRIVLDVSAPIDYHVIPTKDKTKLYIALKTFLTLQDITGEIPISNNDIVIDEPNNQIENISENVDNISGEIESSGEINNLAELEINSSGESGDKNLIVSVEESGEYIIIEPSGEKVQQEPIYTEEELKNRIKISSVKYSSSNNTIKITGNKAFEYDDLTKKDSDTIILHVHNAVLNVEGPTTVSPNNKNIINIRFYQLDDMTVAIEIEMKKAMTYDDIYKNNVLQISVEEPTYQNLTYTSDNNSGKIVLNDVDKSVFTVVEDTKKHTYTIKYSESRFTCGKETLTIDDKWLSKIKISTGKIILEGKENSEFTMEQEGKNAVIKVTEEVTIIENVGKNTTNEKTETESNNVTGRTNTINRTTKFAVNKISSERIQVGRIFINNKSGIELDLNELAKKSTLAINKFANVLIYHTHTTESYVESGIDSNFHTTDNTLNVVAAGAELAKRLKLNGIGVLHSTIRHDISYNDAYDESLITVQNELKKINYDLVIDLHRDAISSDLYYGPTATINGKKAAKMMLVMGSTGAGLYNPNWMENLKTAILIQDKAEEMYPGLFRDLSLVKYRYNQHLSPGSVLIEVGATGNTMEEVMTSMQMLGDVLAALDK